MVVPLLVVSTAMVPLPLQTLDVPQTPVTPNRSAIAAVTDAVADLVPTVSDAFSSVIHKATEVTSLAVHENPWEHFVHLLENASKVRWNETAEVAMWNISAASSEPRVEVERQVVVDAPSNASNSSRALRETFSVRIEKPRPLEVLFAYGVGIAAVGSLCTPPRDLNTGRVLSSRERFLTFETRVRQTPSTQWRPPRLARMTTRRWSASPCRPR